MEFNELKKILPGLKENISLKNYTTFRIGGRARYFFIARKKEDLIKAILVAKKLKLPFFILGEGSNLLVADKGYKGLIIKIKNKKLKIKNTNKKSKIIEAGAGVLLNQLVNIALKNNLRGLEWAVGIPGTVGGAIWGNAGAFGKSIKDVVREVEVLDTKDLRFKIYNLRNCEFNYRDSIFKKRKNLIIFSAEIQLKKESKEKIQKKIKEYLDYRKATQPLNFPSAGSIFKNFTPHRNEVSGAGPALKAALKEFNRKDMIPAAYLIEKCGLKGKRIGDARISEKHADFIVNLGKAKAKDIKKLIELVKKRTKERFKIELEEEIQYLGFEN